MARFIVLTLWFLTCKALWAQTGYIRLQGDQFIDEHGEPFFPMIMNYYVGYYYTVPVFPVDPTPIEAQNLFHARSSLFSQTGVLPASVCQNAEASILVDLLEMKSQGFNTIRFLSNMNKKANGDGFVLHVKRCPTGQEEVLVNMDPSSQTGLYEVDATESPALWFHLNAILQVCSLANTIGMKVIVEVGVGSVSLASNLGDAINEDHVSFLGAVAGFLHQHQVTNILAYELYGEPTYGDRPSSNTQLNLPVHSKAEICALVNSWNRAIKDADPDHLTTIGGVNVDDIGPEGWDPLLLEVDFADMHLYPQPSEYDYDETNPTDDYVTFAIERFLNKVKWYDAYLKKPYILSETGFSGETSTNPYLRWPLSCWGTEAQQDRFLRETFAAVRDSRCAGYGWWIFMNLHWITNPTQSNTDPTSPDYIPLFQFKERYFGLLRFGNPDPTTGWVPHRKLAASTLVDWTTNPPPPVSLAPIPSTLDMSDRYFNPNLHPTNSTVYWPPNGSTLFGTLSGQVLSSSGTPIPGATVTAGHHIGMTLGQQPERIFYAYSTFTDANGNFEIRGFDPLPSNHLDFNNPNPDAERTIENVMIGAYASSWEQRGWNGEPFVSNTSYSLNSFVDRYDPVLDGVVVGPTESISFHGLNTLTALQVGVIGAAGLKARYEVNLRPGFEAVAGSECHVYTEPLYLDCEEIEQVDLKSNPNSVSAAGPSRYSGSATKEIDLALHTVPRPWSIQVSPNPAKAQIAVILEGALHQLAVWNLRLLNLQGQMVHKEQVTGSEHVIDISNLAPGAYSVQADLGHLLLHQRLVKQ